jgi:signal transduction histidine kinase
MLARAPGLRVAAWYAAIFVVSAMLVGVIGYQLLASSLERRDHELLHVKLAEYAARYQSGGLRALSVAVGAERASSDPESVLVRLVAPTAEVLLVSAPSSWPEFEFDQSETSSTSPDETWRIVPSASRQMTLEMVSHVLGDGTIIEVGRTTIGRDRLLGDVRNVFGLLVIVVVAVGLVGGAAITLQALRPLRELSDAVRTIARTGQLSARVPARPGGDIVDELSDTFNQMVTRIETLVDGMSGALDNVAHDLRTPIARLRAKAEAALAGPADAATARAALADCMEEADRVIALLSTLMDISEAQTGTMKLALEAVSAADLATETIDLYEDAADERGITIVSEVGDDLYVQADRQRLRQALANLVDNALKYTGRGGRVTIAAERRGSTEVTLRVTDTGAGIAAEDLPRIWDRLYRGDASRSEPGLGLGLSLVRAIATAHGGRADVTSRPGEGSTFELTLPAESAPPPGDSRPTT